MTFYKTVKFESKDEFYEKKSRFIGYVKPIQTEKEAIEFINYIKSKNWNAKHNAYAYFLKDGQTIKCSDDGEPQGTAGKPILNIINKKDVKDIVIVVTRYFGGVLLGVGGLTRAYSHAAKIALNAGKIITMQSFIEFSVVCNYEYYGKIISAIAIDNGKLKKEEFLSKVYITAYIENNKALNLNKKLLEISSGNVVFKIIGETFLPDDF